VTFRSNGQVSIFPDNVQIILFTPHRARWLRLLLVEAYPGHSWSVGELAIFGTPPDAGESGIPFELPVLSDPTSSEALERRLRLEADREPWSNRPLVDLSLLYRRRGDRERLAEIERMAARRFAPQTLVGWRFGRDLVFVGYDSRALGPRRFEITYYWCAARKMAVDYAIYAHFAGPGFRFQDDYTLGAPARTTTTWEAGEIVKEKRVVEVPAKAPDGVYALSLGAWDPEAKRRIERTGSWWRRTGDILLDVVVGPEEVRWVRRTVPP
jgi:hypothetical protein